MLISHMDFQQVGLPHKHAWNCIWNQSFFVDRDSEVHVWWWGWLGKEGQYGISQENPQRLTAMRFTCNRIYKLARGVSSRKNPNSFRPHLLTVVGVDCDCEPTPQMRDFMDWKLEKDGDQERLEEHRFSMALKVVKDLAIFSSSKVIRAFWKSQKRDCHKNPLSCIMFSK